MLDWLDSRLAPLGEQGSQFYLRLVDTDVPEFKRVFERVRIVEGAAELARDGGLLVDGLRPAEPRVLPRRVAREAHRCVIARLGDAPRAVVLHPDAPRRLAVLG